MPIVYKSGKDNRAMIVLMPEDKLNVTSMGRDVSIIEGPISAWKEFYFLLQDEFIGEGKP
jgi:hypothetical protein